MSWDKTRSEVWERDGRKCRKCGRQISLYDTNWIEEPDKSWRPATELERLQGKLALGYECHHIIPVVRLRRIAWEAVDGIEDWDRRYRQFKIAFLLLYMDKTNLMTLCLECHKKIHRTMRMNQRGPGQGDYTKYLRRWRDFVKLNAMGTQKMLSDYF